MRSNRKSYLRAGNYFKIVTALQLFCAATEKDRIKDNYFMGPILLLMFCKSNTNLGLVPIPIFKSYLF